MPESRPTSAEAAVNPSQYDRSVILRNGTAVRVRAVRPDDKVRLIQLFRNLEKRSIYSRFLYDKRELSPEDLQLVAEVNFETDVTLVATIEEDEEEFIIGVGRFSVIEDPARPRRAEIAFTVREDYQNQGMAGMLLRHLSEIAARMKIGYFEADVLGDNRGMLKVFQKSGLPIKTSFRNNIVHVTIALDQMTM
jgi:RimJ/RimL family protein N-acetyltransferase